MTIVVLFLDISKGNLTQRAPSCFPVPAAAAKPRGESNAGAWIPRVPPPTRPVLRPSPIGGSILALARLRWRFLSAPPQLMDMPGPRWKKGKDGKDFAALAAAQPMSSIVAKLQSSLKESKLVATLSSGGGDAVLGVNPQQAALLNRAAFGRALENAGAEKQWFQLGAEEVFYLGHALECIVVESAGKDLMSQGELWDHLCSASESFPEMYKAYSHLRSKNWVVRSGLQYGTDFVAYRHHPALVHSEFAVVVVPEGSGFGGRRGRLKVWSDLLCALRSSGSVAKTLLVLTISSNVCELRSPDCLEQLVVHERTITRWIAQQCREQRCKPCREEAYKEEQDHTGEPLVFNYLGVILGFTVLSSLLVYKLRFRQ